MRHTTSRSFPRRHDNKLHQRCLARCVPWKSPNALSTSEAARHSNAQTHPSNKTTGVEGVAGRKEWTLKQACFQGYPESAVYVQVPIGSRNPAIHNAYHTSLRPSSLFEPRHRSLKVINKKWTTISRSKAAKASKSKKVDDDKNWKEVTSTHPALPPLSFCKGALMQSPSPSRTSRQEFTVVLIGYVRMILPQVHLRKPCYDFSFL